jgi:hypothetical protein
MFIFENFIRNYKNSYKFFENMFYAKYKIHNQLVTYSISLLNKLKYDKEYNTLLEEYKSIKGTTDRKEELKALLKEHRESIGLSKSGLEKYVKKIQKKYSKYISSQEARVIASDVWQGCKDCLYKGAKLHYKRLEDIKSVSAKSLKNGIKYDSTTNCVFFNDFFVELIFKDYNKAYIEEVFKNKLKYCKLVRKPFSGGYRYYIQMVFDGTSPIKYTKGLGESGIDPGTKTMAIACSNKCMLEELAVGIEKFNKDIIKVQRKMERSRRQNNPSCYNEDGTIKKGSKFLKTKNYKKLSMKLKTLFRKKSEYKKLSDYLLIKEIASNSSTIYCEKVNYKALAKKSKKETKKSTKTKTVVKNNGTIKTITKNQSKRKYGKSLNNKGPAMFIERLKKKSDFLGIDFFYINTKTFKASQYNHIFDDFRKKSLNQRYVVLLDDNFEEIIVQRDLYSAFLIANSNKERTLADRSKCLKNFKTFYKNHNKCLEKILNKETKRLSSFGF